MGVVNVTPDSFSDGGQWYGADAAIGHGLDLAAQGADIVDVGGESTRPGAQRIDEAEELRRIGPVVTELARAGLTVSIDTMRARVAEFALDAGAQLVNDVSGGLADPDMPRLVAAAGVSYVVVHWRGYSQDMYARAVYADVVTEVRDELAKRVDAVVRAGVDPGHIVLDPGLGFGKRPEHNWPLRGRLAGEPVTASHGASQHGASHHGASQHSASQHRAVLSVGSNLGDRLGTLQGCVHAIGELPETDVLAVSPVYETAPVGGPAQPDYLNAVLIVATGLSPQDLLAATQRIEAGFGRARAERFGPRTLHIDLIGYDEQISDDPVLTLPHPRAHERAFILAPWHDLDPAARLPGRGSVAALLAGLGRDGVRRQPDLTLAAP